MSLTQSQQDEIRDHLQDKMGGNCPVCESRAFTIQKDMHFHGTIDPEYKQPVTGAILPVVTIICNNCHYIFQLAAKSLGMI
jgi:hypothetical protein